MRNHTIVILMDDLNSSPLLFSSTATILKVVSSLLMARTLAPCKNIFSSWQRNGWRLSFICRCVISNPKDYYIPLCTTRLRYGSAMLEQDKFHIIIQVQAFTYFAQKNIQFSRYVAV